MISYEGRFQDIIPGERIVSTYVMDQDDARISVSLATVQLHPEGSGTRLPFTESGASRDGFDRPGKRVQGTAELLDGLGAFLGGTRTEPAAAPTGR